MHVQKTAKRVWHRWIPAVLALAVAGAIGLLLVTFTNGGAGASQRGQLGAAPPVSTPNISVPNKVQEGNQMLATQQALASKEGPNKKVTNSPNAVATPSSCPIGHQITTEIGAWDGTVVHEQITNVATTTDSSGYVEYLVYAGALVTNLQQGVLIVFQQPTTVCAPRADHLNLL